MMYRRLPNPKSYFGERSTRCVSRGFGSAAVPGDVSAEDDAASTDEAT